MCDHVHEPSALRYENDYYSRHGLLGIEKREPGERPASSSTLAVADLGTRDGRRSGERVDGLHSRGKP